MIKISLIFLIAYILLIINGELIVQPDNEYFYYSGRIDKTSPNGINYTFSWAGVEFRFSATGTTSIQLLFQTTGENWFEIYQDNDLEYPPINVTSPIPDIYMVADQLDPTQQYTFKVVHRNEPLCGIVGFLGVVLDDSAQVVPIPSIYLPMSSRKIEFIGDSITCGYGVAGVNPCQFTAFSESVVNSYAYLTASALDAEVFIESWSGKGMVRNYGYPNITSPDTLPDLYQALIPNNYPQYIQWNFTEYQPDLVVINLGTNDYSAPPTPPASIFIETYVNFINNITTYYGPETKFFVACGPMISDPCCEYVETVAQKTGAVFINLQNLLDSASDIGCNGHPNRSGHLKMFNVTLPIIKSTMGW